MFYGGETVIHIISGSVGRLTFSLYMCVCIHLSGNFWIHFIFLNMCLCFRYADGGTW